MRKIIDKLIEAQALPNSLAEGVQRSKSVRSASPMHRWWAVRSPILARVATYLAVTERQNPDEKFLAELAELSMSPHAESEIRSQIRDTQWRWLWREQENADLQHGARETPSAPDDPRVLDPFAGSGSIVAEATRIGCYAHALDLNPLSFQILKASLVYPVEFGRRNDNFPGSSKDRRWAGLAEEVAYWAKRVHAIAENALSSLYPGLDSSEPGTTPSAYVWVHTAACAKCGALCPVERQVPARQTDRGLQRFRVEGDAEEYEVHLEISPKATLPKVRDASCPRCSAIVESKTYGGPILIAVAVGSGPSAQLVPVGSRTARAIAPWNSELADRLDGLLVGAIASDLLRNLPGKVYEAVARCGGRTFRDLFSPRQLLAGLEYFNAIRQIEGEMRTAGIADDHISSLLTYLAFLLGHLVERNSLGCTWRYSPTARACGTFDRPGFTTPRTFVEQVPHGSVSAWCNGVQQRIRYAEGLSRAADVRLGSATELPYADEYFDAIITDPPFYDRIPYQELSEFYWVWERTLFVQPSETPRMTELVASDQSLPTFQANFQKAISETYRVLKQGRTFAMLLTSRIKEHFESYIMIAQTCGFELLNVKSIVEERQLPKSLAPVTAIAYFRKPFRKPALGADAAVTLKAIEQNRPVLFGALAELLIQELDGQDLAEFIPAHAKGTKPEIVMEVLAESDPRGLLKEYLGRPGIRRVAAKLGVSGNTDTPDVLVDRVLVYFGFTIPAATADMNPTSALDQLKQIQHRIAQIREKSELRGAFLDVATTIEGIVRLAVFGWARVIFERDWRDALT
jgi:16S rRNA G966 N2-methylase RsmD